MNGENPGLHRYRELFLRQQLGIRGRSAGDHYFMEWLFTSEIGKDCVTNRFGFIAPFDTFEDDEKPTDPLAQQVIAAMEDENKTSVAWNFTAFPSQTFKDQFGRNLLSYIKGELTWNEVVNQVKQEWASEKQE